MSVASVRDVMDWRGSVASCGCPSRKSRLEHVVCVDREAMQAKQPDRWERNTQTERTVCTLA